MKKILLFIISFVLLGMVNVNATENDIIYTIKYNGNGATSGEMPYQVELKYNESYVLQSNKFGRTGYSFLGWTKKADGSGTLYANKARVSKLTKTNGATVTMYAKWEPKTYTINYELDGGVNNSANPTTYTPEMAITLKEPTKDGYVFIGWYKDSGLTKKTTGLTKGNAGNKTFYAKFERLKYNIKYNGNGATSGEMPIQTGIYYNEATLLKTNKFSRSGYTFVGWTKKADGSGTLYENKSRVSKLTKTNNATVNLYANWLPKTYTVSYELNGGKNNGDNPITYTPEMNITLQAPTRDGYVFGGWYKDSEFKSKVTSIAKGSSGNKTFYAKWDILKYNIRYSGNGSTSGSMADQTELEYSKSYYLNANAFEKTGYKFTGWNKKSDGSGTAYANKAKVSKLTKTNNATVKLYAQWSLREYTITYELNGGVNNSENPSKFTYLQTVLLNSPSRDGYNFIGWYSDSTFKTKVTKINKGTAKNVKLYAKWEKPVTVEVSTTSVDVPKGDNENIIVTYNGIGTVSCQSADTDIATCGWINGWNGDETTLIINGINLGTTTVTITNTTNNSSKVISVRVVGKKYYINYVLNGGVNNSENPSYYYENTSSISLKDPTRYGYDFDGWYEDAALTDAIYYIYGFEEENKTIYAKWRKGFVLGNIEGIGNSFTYSGYSSTYSVCRLDALDISFETSSYSNSVKANYTARLTKTYNYGSTIQYCYVVLNFYDEANVKIGDTLVSISGLQTGDSGIVSSLTYLDTDSPYITGSVISVRTMSRA